MNPTEYQAGDLVFAHGRGIISAAIRLVQSWRSPKADARWNHVAVLMNQDRHGNWWVIQAEGHGVKQAKLSDVAPGGSYEVVKCPASANPARVVEFALSQVGVKYGFLTVASILLNVLTPKSIAIRKPHTWVCSALVAGSLWYAGWPISQAWKDLYQVTPADLYARV